MKLLKKLGLDNNSPSETILTTYDSKENPHMAAIGASMKNKNKIELKLFKNTQTYKNISKQKSGVINIVSDASFLIKQGLPEIFTNKENFHNFTKSENVNAPYLPKASAIIEFEVEEMVEKTVTDAIGSSKISKTTGLVKNIDILNSYPHPFKRAELYLIETAVLATKAIETKKRDKKALSEKFIAEIKFLQEKCEKIAPNSKELENITKIVKYFE
ncbi:hypothetical protein AKJ49_00440 [candidate division MSBL1 archaeon SCGC-AAA382A03]|uniref:DUF447 domain-containing protein n=1 Tax=candidate division MSBL1 archaeon SCGC-AAA382A03 TaxID=1698278 RepID=A0A133VGN3_9EURY|nr:hypothetical protein AKJ49_00440 [candidate division MSBL1 archaeon SCGC-AAA382A03]